MIQMTIITMIILIIMMIIVIIAIIGRALGAAVQRHRPPAPHRGAEAANNK